MQLINSGKLRQDDPACRSRRPLHHNEGQVLSSLSSLYTKMWMSNEHQVGEGGRGGQGLDKETGRALWDVVQTDR